MSDHNPLVSVITPFYNEEKFIEETIQSVLNQTYQNWELILVDDGSTNNSTDIARRYSQQFPEKVRYYEHSDHRNLGSSASRNKGIHNARGKVIAFLDADDILKPGYLECQIKLLTATQAAMICEATEYWHSWCDQNKEDEIIPVGAPQDQFFQPQELNLILYPLIKGAAAPCMCGIVVKKDALIKHGEFDESFTGMYDDQVFLSKMYYNETVYISSNCNNRYRQRPGSLMSTAQTREEYIRIRTRFLIWFNNYLENTNNVNRDIHSLLRKTLLPYKYPRYHSLFHVLPRRILNKIRKRLAVNSNQK